MSADFIRWPPYKITVAGAASGVKYCASEAAEEKNKDDTVKIEPRKRENNHKFGKKYR